MAALGGTGEGLDAELVCFGLQEKTSKTHQVTGNQGEVGPVLLTGLYTTCLLGAISPPAMGSSSVVPTPQGPKPDLKVTLSFS